MQSVNFHYFSFNIRIHSIKKPKNKRSCKLQRNWIDFPSNSTNMPLISLFTPSIFIIFLLKRKNLRKRISLNKNSINKKAISLIKFENFIFIAIAKCIINFEQKAELNK